MFSDGKNKENKMSEKPETPARRAKPVRLHAKAFFRSGDKRWSSELGWAVVLYIPGEDDIKIKHSWGQRAKESDDNAWARPIFPKKSREYFLRVSRRLYEDGYPRRHRPQDEAAPKLKGHLPQGCQLCKQLGRSCIERQTRNKNMEQN